MSGTSVQDTEALAGPSPEPMPDDAPPQDATRPPADPADTPAGEPIVTVIEAPRGWIGIDWAELWQYRELLGFFLLRNLKGRMKQTVLGPLWIVLPPMVGAGVFSMLFGVVAGLPSGGEVPYGIMVFAGSIMWRMFSGAANNTSNCLASNANIFTKVYIPRLLLPISSAIAGIVEFFIQLSVLAVALVIYQITPGWQILLLPVYIVIATLMGMGIGIWLAALGVKYRDVRMITVFAMPFWMWLTPIAYSSGAVFENERIPGEIRELVEILYQLNPLFAVVEGSRWCLLGDSYGNYGQPQWLFLIPLAVMAAILVSGLYYFRRVEATFADVI